MTSGQYLPVSRSKNLDILFKRDYYEQRLAIQRQISEAEKEAAEAEEGGVEPEEVLRFLNAKMSELKL